MRAHLLGLAGSIVLIAAASAGCGSDSGAEALDPSPSVLDSVSPSTTDPATPTPLPSITANGKAVSVQKTCDELYHPPGQWMPRANEFVHGSPSADPASEAGEIVDGLADVAGHALGPLADDIAIVRVAVDDQRASLESDTGAGPDVAAFDAAGRRLAHHCEFYND